ncbi:MAG: hypothetical protein HRT90_08555 [Candidatus Margulisbacteria bacterium]|nr:hypothetical protein [Candidatus Margulisiibacteriota bacterium]
MYGDYINAGSNAIQETNITSERLRRFLAIYGITTIPGQKDKDNYMSEWVKDYIIFSKGFIETPCFLKCNAYDILARARFRNKVPPLCSAPLYENKWFLSFLELPLKEFESDEIKQLQSFVQEQSKGIKYGLEYTRIYEQILKLNPRNTSYKEMDFDLDDIEKLKKQLMATEHYKHLGDKLKVFDFTGNFIRYKGKTCPISRAYNSSIWGAYGSGPIREFMLNYPLNGQFTLSFNIRTGEAFWDGLRMGDNKKFLEILRYDDMSVPVNSKELQYIAVAYAKSKNIPYRLSLIYNEGGNFIKGNIINGVDSEGIPYIIVGRDSFTLTKGTYEELIGYFEVSDDFVKMAIALQYGVLKKNVYVVSQPHSFHIDMTMIAGRGKVIIMNNTNRAQAELRDQLLSETSNTLRKTLILKLWKRKNKYANDINRIELKVKRELELQGFTVHRCPGRVYKLDFSELVENIFNINILNTPSNKIIILANRIKYKRFRDHFYEMLNMGNIKYHDIFFDSRANTVFNFPHKGGISCLIARMQESS